MLERIKSLFGVGVASQVENFDYYMSDITNVLKVFGIDFWSADWELRKAKRLIFPFFTSFLHAFVFEAIYLMYYRDDPGIIVKSLYVSIGAAMFVLKLTMTIWNREAMTDLVNEIKKVFWRFNGDGLLKKKILIAGSMKMRFFVRLYIGLFILTFTVCITRPIVAVIFYGNFEAPLLVPMPGVPNETWAIFMFNYVHQTIFAATGGAMNAIFDLLQAVLLFQCTFMIDYLKMLLEPLTTIGDEKNESTKKLLKEVYETHLKVKSFVDTCSSVYAIVNLFQLFESAAFLCTSIFAFATAAPDEDQTISLVFAFVALSQPILYCFVGQHVTNKFEELYYKMADINWYQFTREEKLMYLIMLHNIQQPVVIRAYVSELSADVFVTIINSTYSYYAILRTLAA